METQRPTPAPSHGAYLVVLSDVLVAQDLAETIRDFVPDADIIVVANPAQGLAALDPHARLSQAFVSLGPLDYALSPLAAAIGARGGHVVLLGDAAEEAGSSPWPVLIRPFAAETVRQHLQILPDPAAAPSDAPTGAPTGEPTDAEGD